MIVLSITNPKGQLREGVSLSVGSSIRGRVCGRVSDLGTTTRLPDVPLSLPNETCVTGEKSQTVPELRTPEGRSVSTISGFGTTPT